MASITKSSGTLFPLISQMKNQNENQTIVEPKLKRTVGQRQDVRTGDGLTTIMTKVWGLLKKQDEFTKAATKEMNNQVKFRKESKDLMKKNTDVLLKALNVLNKDVTKVMTKILKAEDKSLKEQEKALEQQKVESELTNNFAKEDKKESESSASKRHEEIVELLKKMAGEGGDKDKTKKEKKGLFEKIFDQMGKDFKNLIKDVFVGTFGRLVGNFLAGLALSIPQVIAGGVRLLLANPGALMAAAMVGVDKYFSDKTKEQMAEKMKATQQKQQTAADAGDLKQLEKEVNSQITQELMGPGRGKVSDVKEVMKNKLEKSTTKEGKAALEKFNKENPNVKSIPTSQQSISGKVQNIKAGAESGGSAELGTELLKTRLPEIVANVDRVTAVKDISHQGRPSKHNEGLAMDFTVKGGAAEYAKAANDIKKHLLASNLKESDFKIIDESKNPSRHSTGNHIHVQFTSREAARLYAANNGVTSDPSMVAATALPVAPEQLAMNNTAEQVTEEKPKFLPEMIKDFADLAQSQFKASESLFTQQNTSAAPAPSITPSSNLNRTILDSSELKNKVAKAMNQNQPPVNITNINNTAMSSGTGGSSNIPLTPRSNDSVLTRIQSGISVVV
jgi:hypothetical protein